MKMVVEGSATSHQRGHEKICDLVANGTKDRSRGFGTRINTPGEDWIDGRTVVVLHLIPQVCSVMLLRAF